MMERERERERERVDILIQSLVLIFDERSVNETTLMMMMMFAYITHNKGSRGYVIPPQEVQKLLL
jgi:hypothetical protein